MSFRYPCGGFLLGLSDLFRVSDEVSESRVAMERCEIGVFFDSQVITWVKSMIHALAQQCNCPVFVSLSCRDATQVV